MQTGGRGAPDDGGPAVSRHLQFHPEQEGLLGSGATQRRFLLLSQTCDLAGERRRGQHSQKSQCAREARLAVRTAFAALAKLPGLPSAVAPALMASLAEVCGSCKGCLSSSQRKSRLQVTLSLLLLCETSTSGWSDHQLDILEGPSTAGGGLWAPRRPEEQRLRVRGRRSLPPSLQGRGRRRHRENQQVPTADPCTYHIRDRHPQHVGYCLGRQSCARDPGPPSWSSVSRG